MSDDHEVNEIGRWYHILMYRDVMEKYMAEWMLTETYEINPLSDDQHNYFNYALDRGYINAAEKNRYIDAWRVELTNKGREFLNKGENNEQ
jgi:disulfide oxidoreductase YuzD